MLTITILGTELFNDKDQTFSTEGDVTLDFEHSLVSLSKWESKHKIPFLSSSSKTQDQILDYLKLMVVTPNADVSAIERCSQPQLNVLQAYIDSAESATTFGEMPGRTGPGEVITSELIYYWLVAFTIPFECQSWHLNRLFSLIRICNIKNAKPTKMSKNEVAQRNRDLNARRKAELNTSG